MSRISGSQLASFAFSVVVVPILALLAMIYDLNDILPF